MALQISHCFGALFALSLIGCATPRGPILGDWSGYQPLSTPQGQVSVELVMYGRPHDKSGAFRIYKQMQWTEGNASDGSVYLNGKWSSKSVTVKGETWRNYTLTAPEVNFPTYVLRPDNYLVPAKANGTPDMSDAGWGCCRLAPRTKGSFGYGRA